MAGLKRDPMKRTPSQTEDSAEQGLVKNDPRTGNPVSYEDLGEKEELNPDEESDIADEGPGHRG